MKPMLEGEYRRFRRALWFIYRLLILTPLVAFSVAAIGWSLDALCVAVLITIQNLVAAWVIGQYEYKRW